MERIYRFAFTTLGVLLLIFGAGLLWQQTWATGIWLWPAAPRLSNIFMSSIVAAIAVPILWIGLSGQIGASVGGALNLLVVFSGSGIFLLLEGTKTGAARTLTYAFLFITIGVIAIAVYLYTRRFPVQDSLRIPPLLRWSFAVFAVVLIITGTGLVRLWPHIFPWRLAPDMSIIYGWIFLGAAVYFAYGFLRPSWQNAQGQLLGFLAYDLVLILPYLQHWSNVLPEHRLSLIIYLTVIIYSGLLAAFFLLTYRPGRERETFLKKSYG
jgi:hypothetical protein